MKVRLTVVNNSRKLKKSNLKNDLFKKKHFIQTGIWDCNYANIGILKKSVIQYLCYFLPSDQFPQWKILQNFLFLSL